MNAIKSWWPSIVAVLGAIAPIVLPAVKDAISHHPQVAVVLGAIYAILSHLLPSPVATAPASVK